MLAEFIDLILTLCFTLVPFAAAGFVAFVVCSIVFKIADNKEREERREAHKAQTASDMCEMQKCYIDAVVLSVLKEEQYAE